MMTSNLIFGGYGNISFGDVCSNDDITGGDDGSDDDVVGDGGGAALGSSSLLVKSPPHSIGTLTAHHSPGCATHTYIGAWGGFSSCLRGRAGHAVHHHHHHHHREGWTSSYNEDPSWCSAN